VAVCTDQGDWFLGGVTAGSVEKAHTMAGNGRTDIVEVVVFQQAQVEKMIANLNLLRGTRGFDPKVRPA